MINISIPLIAGLSTQLFSQIIKMVSASIRKKRLVFSALFYSGGMPSSHTAFVTALSLSCGLHSGFTSDAFAVALVFSTIVIHDAFKIRGNIQKQALLLNRITSELMPDEEKMVTKLGHTKKEIFWGVILGIGTSLLFYFLFV